MDPRGTEPRGQLNGKTVGNALFAPGFTSYQNRLQVQVYDLRPYAVTGENRLEIQCANGWAVGYLGRGNIRHTFADHISLAAELTVTAEKNCAWSFAGTVDSISLAQDEAAGTLTVTVSAADGATWTLTFSEEGFSAQNAPEQTLEFGSGNDPVAVSGNGLEFCHEEGPYAVRITQGSLQTAHTPMILQPKDGSLAVRLKR